MRSEFDDIADAFDLLPALSAGAASRAVVLASDGLSLTTTTGTLALAGNLALTGAFNTTFVVGATVSITLPTMSGLTLATLTGTETLTNKTLVAPALGTPVSGVATNLTGTAAGLTAGAASAVALGGITGLGTGVATALAIAVGSAGAPVLFNGAGGTPSSMTATNLTGTASGLTAGVASAVAVGGITGLGTGVATALAINIGSAGAPVLFNGAGGTPSSMTATNLTGTAAGLTAGTASAVAASGITGTTLAANVVTSSLTAVGTITSGTWNAGTVTSSGLVKASAAGGFYLGANLFADSSGNYTFVYDASGGSVLQLGNATVATSIYVNDTHVFNNRAGKSIFNIDGSTASAVAGLKITAAVTGGTVALVATDEGSNTNLTINAKGSGTIGIGSVSTGRVTITPVTTITGALTVTGGIVGTTTNNSATALNVGEYVEASLAIGSATGLVTGTAKTVTSISLTAGDWDVSGTIGFTGNGSTTVDYYLGCLSLTTNTEDSTNDREVRGAWPTASTMFAVLNQSRYGIPRTRFSLASTTTIYLVAQGGFAVSTMSAFGQLQARRVR